MRRLHLSEDVERYEEEREQDGGCASCDAPSDGNGRWNAHVAEPSADGNSIDLPYSTLPSENGAG